jgi:SAM-dependent methyltransferase
VSHIEQQTRSAWDAYGQHHLKRGTPLPDVDRITWGPGLDGPGDEVLGDLEGLRVLNLGCGTGRHAAHLARAYGSRADGVDASSSQIERARAHRPDVPGLCVFHADAVDHLGREEPYDVIYSVSAVHFFDPHRLSRPW